MVKKVCVIGPECTGKTELSSALAGALQTVWVPEFARNYLTGLNRTYEEKDLLAIAQGQTQLEDSLAKDANQILVCDTNLIVIKIWSQVKYGRCDEQILQMMSSRQYDLYLLTYIDIPWENDPLREHPEMRDKLYRMYVRELAMQKVPFVQISGTREKRLQTALEAIEEFAPPKR